MIDSLVHFREAAGRSTIVRDLGLREGGYMVVTLHRPSNVDRKESMVEVLGFFEKFAARVGAVFPVHPRTRKMLSEFGLMERASKIPGLQLIDPLGYLDFLRLMQDARFVLTDSGGIQEETTYLGIPCLTLRDNTERPITVTEGSNVLCGSAIANAVPHVESILAGTFKRGLNPALWDGKAAERIVEIILAHLKERT
jgi:UDP-N-acetylglucosamine 2-epimerase (non-hydrolysing)